MGLGFKDALHSYFLIFIFLIQLLLLTDNDKKAFDVGPWWDKIPSIERWGNCSKKKKKNGPRVNSSESQNYGGK